MSRKHRNKIQLSFLVSIIIPVYGRCDLLKKCLNAIPDAMGNLSYEVIIIDNNSPEGDRIPKDIQLPPNTKLLLNSKNVGFPAACNRGFRLSSGALLFFLNSDVILEKGSVDKLVRVMDDPGVGAVGMKLLFPAEGELSEAELKHSPQQRMPEKVQHVGLFMNMFRDVIHMYLGWKSDNPRVNAVRDVFAVTGAAFMTRKQLYKELGGFDEIYGMGCLTEDTFLYTKEGIKSLKDFITSEDTGLYPLSIDVSSDKKERPANMFYVNGEEKTIKVTLSKDFSLQGTLNHKIKVMSKEGDIVWKELQDLQLGDYVAIRQGMNIFGENHLDKDDAYLLGLYLAEGSYEKCGRITITNSDRQIQEFLISRGFLSYKENDIHFRKQSVDLCSWFSQYVDLSRKAFTKEISSFLLQSNKETQIALLQGMFDGDGCAFKDGTVSYSTSSYKMAKQLQVVLLNFGVVAGIYLRGMKGKENYVLECGRDSETFFNKIGFRLSRKQSLISSVKSKRSVAIPYQRERFKKLYTDSDIKSRQYNSLGCHANNPCDAVRKDTIQLLIDKKFDEGENWSNRDLAHFGVIVSYDWVWLKVKKIEDGGIQPTYDLHIPNNHIYIANGFVVHNTYEEVDYCMKLRDRRLKVIVETSAVGKHYTGATSEKFQLGFPLNQNRVIFMQRWYNKLIWDEWRGW